MIDCIMDKEHSSDIGQKIRICTILFLLIVLVLFIRTVLKQNISSVEGFRDYLAQFGMMGPLVLTVIQAFQVVVPVLPGYLGCAAGAVAFGTITGFLCNYIGISAGSIAAYFIAKKFGVKVVQIMFSDKQYRKWSKKIVKKKSYDRFLFVATLLPLFPDDFLCYFSGVIKMDTKRFVLIILLGKPWCILAYSIIFGMIR